MSAKGSDCSPDMREENTKPRFKRTIWANSFYGALAAILLAPGVSIAQSTQYLNQEVQELRDEVNALKKQQDAGAPGTQAAAKSSDDQQPVTFKGATLDLGGLKLTLGGFIAAESVWRHR